MDTRNLTAARTICDALGLQVEPSELAVLMTRATRAWGISNYDDYRNQCDSIKALIHGEKAGAE